MNNVTPNLLTADDPVNNAASATMQKVQMPAISRNFQLFCGIADNIIKIVAAPELNPAISQLFARGNAST